jgi:hypothetical protein
MAVVLENKEPGLLHENKLRESINARLTPAHFNTFMHILKEFKQTKDPAKKTELAYIISGRTILFQNINSFVAHHLTHSTSKMSPSGASG